MKAIHTDNAPKAIGPYAQAVACNGFLYTSGQVALNPKTGELLPADVSLQTRQVFENLKAVLEAGKCTFESVVKTTVFLTDMANFPILNEIYAQYMGNHKPARSTIAVSGLPKGALVEIEMIAKLP